MLEIFEPKSVSIMYS